MHKDKIEPAPCFVNEGTIFHKKDMLRALETFENLKYEYIVDGQVVQKGEGVLLKVFASRNSATLIINNCIFVNVLSFNYLNFKQLPNGQTAVELIEDSKALRIESTDEEVRPARVNKEILASVDQFDDEETFALLEEGDREADED